MTVDDGGFSRNVTAAGNWSRKSRHGERLSCNRILAYDSRRSVGPSKELDIVFVRSLAVFVLVVVLVLVVVALVVGLVGVSLS